MTNKTNQIHPVQGRILRVLLLNQSARFSDLNTGDLSNDHFTFHVKKLLEEGLVLKRGDGLYELTTDGKEFANRFDIDSGETKIAIERQAKVGVVVCAARGEGERREYLMQQRLKQPFYGYWGFVTGKIKWGETVLETAARELEEETGLTGDVTLRFIKHKMDYDKEGKLLEDKYFFECRVDNVKGVLLETFEGGRNKWMTRDQIFKLENIFDGLKEHGLDLIEGEGLSFREDKYTVTGY